MTMKKKVFVKAYTAYNLGDDLFLDILFKRYPHVDFVLDTSLKTYNHFVNKYSNVSIIGVCLDVFPSSILSRFTRKTLECISLKFHKKKFTKYINNRYSSVLESCDAFVAIGGSMFMQLPSYKYSYDLYFYEYIINNFPRMKKFFLGCNFGPYKSEWFLSGYRRVFSRFDDVSFRDKYSYDLFSSLRSVRINPDIVLMFKGAVSSIKDRKKIGITIRKSDDESISFLKKHIEIIGYLVRKCEFEVLLFSFCENEGDEAFAKELLDNCCKDELLKSKVDLVLYNEHSDIDSFIYKYSSVYYMFAERFHSMILSILFEQLVIPISYSKKMDNVLSDISFKNRTYNIQSFINMNVSDVNILLSQDKFRFTQNYIDSAVNHFIKLDNFLNE